MTVIVRWAASEDIEPIFAMGSKEPAFRVSSQIRFYERSELEEWATDPEYNILLVLDDEGTLAGFLFCKVMSSHWAYLDNFYVAPPARGHAYGHMLLAALTEILREKQISYFSALVAETDSFLTGYSGKNGLESEKKYVWMEKFVG
jgi:GNAT superfamily N-acetyltransferase